MLLSKFLDSLIERHHPAFFRILHTSPDGGNRFGTIQAVKHLLIGFGILNDQLGAAVYGKHKRRLFLLEPANVLFDVPLELSHRANFSQVDHGAFLVVLKADNSTLP